MRVILARLRFLIDGGKPSYARRLALGLLAAVSSAAIASPVLARLFGVVSATIRRMGSSFALVLAYVCCGHQRRGCKRDAVTRRRFFASSSRFGESEHSYNTRLQAVDA